MNCWSFAGGEPELGAPTAPAPYTAVIIGDIRIEVRAELTGSVFTDLEQDAISFSPARVEISGTAVNVAKEAIGVFREVTIISKIGSDGFTAAIRQYIDALGVRSNLILDPDLGNGVVIIVRDENPDRPGGVRLLVSGTPAPSHGLDTQDVDEAKSELMTADLVYFDGYSIIRPTSALAIAQVLEIRAASNGLTCVDLVPHNLYDYLSVDELRPYLMSVSCVITEARTMAGMLKLPHDYPFTFTDVTMLLPALDEYVPKHPYWILRYGQGDMEETLIYRRGELSRCYSTGYAMADRMDRAGYGDKIAVRELAALLSAWPGDAPAGQATAEGHTES
jgi:sugar/nucleoside kinase (ribokinase family)